MQPDPWRLSSPSAPQGRRSSGRRSSRQSSLVGLPPERRTSTRSHRSHSASKQNGAVPLDDFAIDWNDPNLLADFALDPNNFPENILDGAEYGAFAQQPGFDNIYDFHATPDVTRASVNLLQNPFSALPGTPQVPNFHEASNGFLPPGQFDLNFDLMHGNIMQPNTPKHGIGSRKASGASPRSMIRAPQFTDGFAGYVDTEQDFAYPSPDYQYQGALSVPYYDGTASRETNEVLGERSSGSPSKRRFSQSRVADGERETRSKAHSRRNSSYHSSSSYPDRSGQSAAGDRMHATTRVDVNKRKSVVDHHNIYQYSQPRLDAEKPWIRINRTTRGETTRSAKCNDYDPSQFYTLSPHPVGDWSSGRYDFKYTNYGEWKEWKMPAAAIRDFILRYPENAEKGKKLKLFIQVAPTDSARRYLSQTWTKCRFAECPTYKTNMGTILHGHYRVAFDERSWGTTREDPYDPHLAAGAYVHLYCFERFLDMEYICRKAHIFVDDRNFPKEPRGRFAATLAGHPEYEVAHSFIEEAKRPDGDVRTIQGFENYPRHHEYKGKPKPHEHTLVYRMHEAKKANRPPAQMKQFLARGLGPTHLVVNYGDLEVYMQAKMEARMSKNKSKAAAKKRKVLQISSDEESSSDSLSSGEDIVYHKKTKYPKKPTERACKKARRSPIRRKHYSKEDWDGSDSETDEELISGDRPSVPGTRRSARSATRKRKNYREVEDPPLDPDQIAILQGYVPASGYAPQQALQPQQAPARNPSIGPFVDPELEGLDFDAYFGNDGLNRRLSSLSGRRTSIMRRVSNLSRRSSGKRHASFSQHPVSHRQEFDIEAPPRDVESSPRRLTRATTPYIQVSLSPRRTRAAQSGQFEKKTIGKVKRTRSV